MSKTVFSIGSLSFLLALPAISSAGLFFNGANDYSAEAGLSPLGKMDAQTDLLSSDLFINSIALSGGTFGSSGLALQSTGGYFDRFDGSGSYDSSAFYSFGTALASGYSYYSLGAFGGLIGFSGTGVTGTYTGTVDVFGGSSSSANDVLATVNFTIEIVSSYGVSVSYPTNDFTVGPSQTATLQNRVVNSSSREFKVNSRYYSYFNAPSGFTIDFDPSYPSSFAANSDVTVDSLKFTGGTGGPQWTGADNGISGGYFSDDINSLPGGGQFTVTPVPEPTTMAALGLGLVALARRRRQA